MTLTRSWVRDAVTTPLDARLMNLAGVVANADGSPRTGVLGSSNPSIVSALGTMHVAIDVAEFATSKGRADGVAIFANDGVVQVAITAAPVANSRIDTIWVKHNDNTTGDANALPVFGVTDGVAAAVPVKAAIPTGALELATLRVYAGTTAANGGTNTLTNTYRMTAARGGVVAFRTYAELAAWVTAAPGQQAYVIATGETFRFSIGTWLGDGVAIVPLTTFSANWSATASYSPFLVARGKMRYLYGAASRAVGGSLAGILTVPVGHRPSQRLFLGAGCTSGGTVYQLNIDDSTGLLSVPYGGGSAAAVYPLLGFWETA